MKKVILCNKASSDKRHNPCAYFDSSNFMSATIPSIIHSYIFTYHTIPPNMVNVNTTITPALFSTATLLVRTEINNPIQFPVIYKVKQNKPRINWSPIIGILSRNIVAILSTVISIMSHNIKIMINANKISDVLTPDRSVRFQIPSTRLCDRHEMANRIPPRMIALQKSQIYN